MEKLVVIALGGNALQVKGEAPTIDNQIKNVKIAVKNIAELISKGYKVVVTHGNGPQVGRLVLQGEIADSEETPAFPFDVSGAMSQALIGYHIQQKLAEELKKLNNEKPVATVLTQVLVDEKDPGFEKPSKPIGPYYTKEEKETIEKEKGYNIKEDSGRGYRRVVASPEPVEVIELDTIKTLLDNNNIVICCGGGGVPVVHDGTGLKGVAAVIDKDKASSLLAQNLNAEELVILTDVQEAFVNFNKPDQKALKKISSSDLKQYVNEDQFYGGSMLPKVESILNFVDKTGNTGRITSLDLLNKSFDTEEVGTIVNK